MASINVVLEDKPGPAGSGSIKKRSPRKPMIPQIYVVTRAGRNSKTILSHYIASTQQLPYKADNIRLEVSIRTSVREHSSMESHAGSAEMACSQSEIGGDSSGCAR